MVKYIILLLAFVFLSCAGNKLLINSPYPAVQVQTKEEPIFTIYAVGDAGEDNAQSRAVLQQLASMATDDTQPGMVIFLGDNIYPAGFAPPSDADGFKSSGDLLRSQTQALDGYGGQILFIPGNHDWNEFKPGGLEAIRRQADFLHGMNDPRIRMLPENGCGGPVTLQLSEDIMMLILDSQWWIQDWEKEPEMNSGCDIKSREEFKLAVHKLIRENKDKQILVAMHHPLFTQGHHGGHFTFRDHLFPLTKVVKWLWLPLPVIGSIYPWYRTVLGHPQDIKNPKYRSLKEAILEDLDYEGELVFLAGHDHNLQYITSGKNHFLLSGGGAKQNQVANGKDLVYGHKAAGFMQLNFYIDQSIQLTVYEIDIANETSSVVFRQNIVGGVNLK